MRGLFVLLSALLIVSTYGQITELGSRIADSTKGDSLTVDTRCLADPVPSRGTADDQWKDFIPLPGAVDAPTEPLKICDIYGLFPPNFKFLAASFTDDAVENKLTTSTGESLYFNGASVSPPDATAAFLLPWTQCGTHFAAGPLLDGSCPGLTPAADTSKTYLGLEDGGANFGWFCTPGAAATIDPGEMLLMRLALPVSSSATVSGILSIFAEDLNRETVRAEAVFTCFDAVVTEPATTASPTTTVAPDTTAAPTTTTTSAPTTTAPVVTTDSPTPVDTTVAPTTAGALSCWRGIAGIPDEPLITSECRDDDGLPVPNALCVSYGGTSPEEAGRVYHICATQEGIEAIGLNNYPDFFSCDTDNCNVQTVTAAPTAPPTTTGAPTTGAPTTDAPAATEAPTTDAPTTTTTAAPTDNHPPTTVVATTVPVTTPAPTTADVATTAAPTDGGVVGRLVDPTEWDAFIPALSDGSLDWYYNLRGDRLYIAMKVEATTGWVGWGVKLDISDPFHLMRDSDLVFVNECVGDDRLAGGRRNGPKDGPDDIQNLDDFECVRTATHTHIHFSRLLDTGDTEQDFIITPETDIGVIVAYSPTSDIAGVIQRHSSSQRAGVIMQFEVDVTPPTPAPTPAPTPPPTNSDPNEPGYKLVDAANFDWTGEGLSDGRFDWHYSIRDGEIHVGLKVEATQGWIGWGVKNDISDRTHLMRDSDIVFIWSTSTTCEADDRLAGGGRTGPRDGPDAIQNLDNFECYRVDGYTHVFFSRKLSTGDAEQDFVIKENTDIGIIIAYDPTWSTIGRIGRHGRSDRLGVVTQLKSDPRFGAPVDGCECLPLGRKRGPPVRENNLECCCKISERVPCFAGHPQLQCDNCVEGSVRTRSSNLQYKHQL